MSNFLKKLVDDIFGDVKGPPTTNEGHHTGSPWDPSVNWQNGLPDRLPSRDNPYRYAWQYEADRQTELYRRGLYDNARGAMRQGLGLLQSYRPGGASALASGMYQGLAGISTQQAAYLESPDVMMQFRDEQQIQADLAAQRSARFARYLGMVNTVASLFGGGTQPPGDPAAASLPQNRAGGGGGAGVAPLTGQEAAAGFQMLGPGVGKTNQATQFGTGGVPAPPPGISAPQTLGAESGGVGQGGPAGFRLGAGLGMGGDFSNTAAASAGMMASDPIVEHEILNDWTGDPMRRSNVDIMVQTARAALRAEMARYV